VQDARKQTITRKEALAFARQFDEIFASKGKQVVQVNLKAERLDDAALAGLVLGPTGNLRAPAMRVGRTLIVGFDEATYLAGRRPAFARPSVALLESG